MEKNVMSHKIWRSILQVFLNWSGSDYADSEEDDSSKRGMYNIVNLFHIRVHLTFLRVETNDVFLIKIVKQSMHCKKIPIIQY